MKINEMSVIELRENILSGKIKSEDVVKHYLDRIKKLDDKIKSYITICEEEALDKAKKIDSKIEQGEKVGKLAGIPIAIKDNICIDGIITTCASKILKDFISPYDATVVKKLKKEDAIIIGKTNMDEFAMGSSTENSAFGPTKNPWNLEKVPGGSSGGSAASVASGLAPFSLGSDTGGSIRQPASFCGVVGLKPTYGLVSRFGLIAFASSLDQIGPFTTNVKDCALLLEVIAGNDSYDSTSVQEDIERNYLSELNDNISDLKIAVPKEFMDEGLNDEIKEKVIKCLDKLEELGCEVEEISLPIVESGLSGYYIISSAEASSNLARYDGVRYGYRPDKFESIEDLMVKSRTEGFGKEVKRRIMLGTYVLSSGYYDAYYKRALKLKKKIRDEFKKAFEKYDIVIGPTSPMLPFSIGEKTDNPLDMYLADIYTVTINIAGLPALSLPCGFSESELPIGIQLIGDHFAESKLLKTAFALEQSLDIQTKNPNCKEVI